MPVVVNERLTIPDAELSWTFSPSGGPGGQHANRSNTRVELTWDIEKSAAASPDLLNRLRAKLGPVLSVTVDDERSQSRNRDIAQRRMAQRIREALVPEKPRRKTKPTRGSKERRLHSKRAKSQNKQLRRAPNPHD